MANQSNGEFSGNTQDNPKNESCKAIELRNKKVLNPFVPKRKEVEEVKEDEVLVEKESDEVENEIGGVENKQEEKKLEGEKNKKKRDERGNNERLINVCSIMRRTKCQIWCLLILNYHTLTCQKRKKSRKGSSRSLWSYYLSYR